MRVNRLTFDQSYELRRWLDSRRAAAAGAKAALGFGVSLHNVDGARKAMGIALRAGDVELLARRVAVLEERVDKLSPGWTNLGARRKEPPPSAPAEGGQFYLEPGQDALSRGGAG
jgi:hypothetical protein